MRLDRCDLCPRECGVDRSKTVGFCGCGERPTLAKAMLHFGEEPCISGSKGSGAVFFGGCVLKCCFCQNYPISSGGVYREVSEERLGEIFLELQARGAHNINLVSPTQFSYQIIRALDGVKDKLKIPVVYNTGGYEKSEIVRELSGYVDIFLTDMKYYGGDRAKKYSRAADYYERAADALGAMLALTGKPVIEDGLMKSGVIVRHLILPGCYHDGEALLGALYERFGSDKFLLSLMSQYTPCYGATDYPEINRRITTFEYRKVLAQAERLGFDGYMQERSSATLEQTPVFDFQGI